MNLAGLVEYIAQHLVANPQHVSVKVIENPHSITLELRVATDDTGRVIGKNGRIANAMRTLVRIAAAREGKRVNLEIV